MQFHVETRGRPKDMRVRESIVQALEDGPAMPDGIRISVTECLGRAVSWNTVASHLNDLVRDGVVKKTVFSESARTLPSGKPGMRVTAAYQLNSAHKVRSEL